MITIKSYTDLEQSKKLAEILPLESADMNYNNYPINVMDSVFEYRTELSDYNTAQKVLSECFKNVMFGTLLEVIPCWSLSALLSVLPSATLDSSDDHHFRIQCKNKFTEWHDNAIDACCEMILKLHELNLL
jgi:hypothetical protein